MSLPFSAPDSAIVICDLNCEAHIAGNSQASALRFERDSSHKLHDSNRETLCRKPAKREQLRKVHPNFADLLSRVLFSFLPPCAGHPSSSLLGTRQVLCSVEQRAQHRAWRGAVSGLNSPKSSGRKFLPEIYVKKGSFSRDDGGRENKGPGLAIPGSPYRGQNWKLRQMTFFGVKKMP